MNRYVEELILKERKTREDLVQVVNNAGLPAFILKPILKDLFEQINLLEQQQYEQVIAKTEAKKNKKEKENKNG